MLVRLFQYMVTNWKERQDNMENEMFAGLLLWYDVVLAYGD
jgi:hypothetical protein